MNDHGDEHIPGGDHGRDACEEAENYKQGKEGFGSDGAVSQDNRKGIAARFEMPYKLPRIGELGKAVPCNHHGA